MKITFDQSKRDKTLNERGLDFADAEIVLDGLALTVVDDREDYRELRLQTVGFLEGRMVMVVWTARGDAVHVISMRKCNDREQEKYGKRFAEG